MTTQHHRTHDQSPTLVMGAAGNVGRLVLDGLLVRGLPVRASMRRPRPGQTPPGVEVCTADLADPASLVPAFDGMQQVFLYARFDGVHAVVEAARAAGIRRVVLLSSGSIVHPSSAGNAITEEHREVEQAFAGHPDLLVVPVRPLVLATNALAWSRSIRADRRVALYRPEALTAPVHERDVADVAVAALLGEDGTSAMLTGPDRLSQRDQVAAIAAALGEEVAVDELTRSAALAHLGRFMPPVEAEAVLQFLDDAADGAFPATGTVERVLGRPATPYGVWARDHVEDFR